MLTIGYTLNFSGSNFHALVSGLASVRALARDALKR